MAIVSVVRSSEASLSAASHVLLASLVWSSLIVIRVVRLHVLSLALIVIAGLSHELVGASVRLLNSVAVRRLVKILVGWLLHVI